MPPYRPAGSFFDQAQSQPRYFCLETSTATHLSAASRCAASFRDFPLCARYSGFFADAAAANKTKACRICDKLLREAWLPCSKPISYPGIRQALHVELLGVRSEIQFQRPSGTILRGEVPIGVGNLFRIEN